MWVTFQNLTQAGGTPKTGKASFNKTGLRAMALSEAVLLVLPLGSLYAPGQALSNCKAPLPHALQRAHFASVSIDPLLVSQRPSGAHDLGRFAGRRCRRCRGQFLREGDLLDQPELVVVVSLMAHRSSLVKCLKEPNCRTAIRFVNDRRPMKGVLEVTIS